MIKKVPVLLLVSSLLVILSACSSKKSVQITVDSNEIVSVSISGYPIIFANGDSIDTTTDTSKISEIVSAFNNASFEKYKTKEEWDKIGVSPTGNAKATITFFDSEKKAIGYFTRVSNAEGTFIITVLQDDVYILTKENYDTLNSIYDRLLEEAETGRLDN